MLQGLEVNGCWAFAANASLLTMPALSLLSTNTKYSLLANYVLLSASQWGRLRRRLATWKGWGHCSHRTFHLRETQVNNASNYSTEGNLRIGGGMASHRK